MGTQEEFTFDINREIYTLELTDISVAANAV